MPIIQTVVTLKYPFFFRVLSIYLSFASLLFLLFLPICFLFFCLFHRKMKNVICAYDRLNGWNSTFQAVYPYIRHAPWACSFYILVIIWCFWTKPAWLVILSFTNFMDGRSRVFYIFNPREGYRSVTSLDAARVNRTIFRNLSSHWYYITRIEGADYIKQAIIESHGQQNPCRGLGLRYACYY